MGSMMTREGIHRHAYAPMAQPARVTLHAIHANVTDAAGNGVTSYPLSGPLSTIASDGAPYYNTGYQPGAAAQIHGGRVPLLLPPVAAQLDLSDRQSWDRPVFFPGST